jgi:hypothetical protein
MSTDIDCESDLREPVRIKVILECIRLGAQNGFADLARILRHFLYYVRDSSWLIVPISIIEL